MISRSITLTYEHRVVFTRDAFDASNTTLSKLMEEALDGKDQAEAMIFVDEGVLSSHLDLASDIEAWFESKPALKLVGKPIPLPGGESCKNDWGQVESIWKHIDQGKLCRHSYVIAVGGGAVLDLVGLAAATAHRGLRHIRMPTTTLSQSDGGVGVKNGVNYFGKKNWVGTFSVPFAVINDLSFLQSLPEEERRDGVIEAVKVALIRDREFFEQIEAGAEGLAELDEEMLETVIRRSAELHMNHIAYGGDPFEQGSSRPLDFGHWTAHKLEQISEFRISHGEAVAMGMCVDLLYAQKKGLLGRSETQRILKLIRQIGFELYDPEMHRRVDGKLAILQGLEEFREHLGGELTVTLVTGIGEAIEVHEMDHAILPEVIDDLRQLSGGGSAAGLQAGKIPATRVA